MKTTNLEISKKLKEIGFEHRTNFYHIADEKCKSRGENPDDYELEYISSEESYKLKKHYNIPSYDLETLLDALPKKITTKFKHFDTGEIYEFEETLKIYKSGISYSHNEDDIDWYRTHYGYYSTFDLSVNNSEGLKSLADTAGKLLIQLFEEGIINFKK